jgi:chromosome segregation ATPase
MPPRKKAVDETGKETLPAKPAEAKKPRVDEVKELAAEKRAIEKEKKALEARREELNAVQAQVEEDRSNLAALWQAYQEAEKETLAKVKKLKAKLEKAEKKIKKLKKKK